jgi:PKD repeat protein
MNKNCLKIIFLSVLTMACCLSKAQTKQIPYQQLQGSTGMFFGASMTTSNITVTFAGPSNKWISLGFGSSMTPADALIYTSGQSSSQHALAWMDYFCGNTSASNVTIDNSQDWTVLSNSVASGQRTVVAIRNLNTSDASDVAISFTSSVLNIVWARGATNDYTLAYHGNTNRGSGIALPWLSQPTASFSVNSQTVCVGSSVTFTNLSSGGLNTYTWALPGTALASSSATNPVVTYTSAGIYSVALTASNVLGTSTLIQTAYITVNPTVVPTISLVQISGANPLCQGSLAAFSVNITNGGPSPQFQWRINNQVVGGNTATFSSNSIGNASSIVCILTSPSVCASPSINTSAAIVLTVNSNAPSTVSVNINSGTNPMCVGALTSFTALTGNGGSSPLFQWKLNGLNIGTNNSTFTSNTLSNGDLITCSLVSNASCAVTNTALSSAIVLTVSALLVPSVNIGSNISNNNTCEGTVVTYTTLSVNGGSIPTFQWFLNGNTVGSNSASYTLSLLSSTNVISCVMTSNSQCANPNSANSNSVSLIVNPIPSAPVISPSGSINLCSGSSIILSSSASNGNTWSTGATGNTISINAAGIYTVTQTQLGCTSLSSTSVNVVSVPSPTTSFVSFNSICLDDNVISLQGNPAGGTFSGTGVTGSVFNPAASGAGSFVLVYQYTDANNCSDTSAIVANVAACLGINSLKNDLTQVSIYPNPNIGDFDIISESNLIISITLTDMNGKVISKKQALNSNKYEFRNITEVSGVYDLEIVTNEGRIHKRIQILK